MKMDFDDNEAKAEDKSEDEHKYGIFDHGSKKSLIKEFTVSQ